MGNNIDLNEIAVKRIGDFSNSDTIVLLHDSLGCIALWGDFPSKLSELTQRNVLIYDRQGYGQSLAFTNPTRDNQYLENEADLLIELLAFWDVKSPILFGHSDGGSIALIAAGKYPDKIKGVLTEGAHIFVEEVTLKGIHEAISMYENTNLKFKLEKYHSNKTDDMFWAWAKTWTTACFKTWNIEQFLPKIKSPCLIIQGEEDEYGTLDQVEKIISGINGTAEKLVLPHVKHTPHKEVPQIVLKKSSAFILNKIEG